MAGARQSTDGASATYRRSSFWLDDLVLTGRDDLAPRAPLAAMHGSTSASWAAG